jgi:hypothetical protein
VAAVTSFDDRELFNWLVVFERACSALGGMVRTEYGKHYTLVHIAETWGERLTPEQVSALGSLEDGSLLEAFDELLHHRSDGRDREPSEIGD